MSSSSMELVRLVIQSLLGSGLQQELNGICKAAEGWDSESLGLWNWDLNFNSAWVCEWIDCGGIAFEACCKWANPGPSCAKKCKVSGLQVLVKSCAWGSSNALDASRCRHWGCR